MSGTITPDELQKMLQGRTPPRVLDVRRQTDRVAEPGVIPGAVWKDPEKASEWGKDLGSGEVVIYCVRGGSVSRTVQQELLRQNINVKFIEGGFEAWKLAGKPVQRP